MLLESVQLRGRQLLHHIGFNNIDRRMQSDLSSGYFVYAQTIEYSKTVKVSVA